MAKRAIFAIILLALTDWAYRSVRTASFVFEDFNWVNQSRIYLTGRGLTTLTWVFTDSPLSAHLVSLGLHVLCGILVGALVYRIGFSELASWAIAGLWLLHRLHVEAVAYAASRSELISAVGILGACLLATNWKRWTWVGIVICLVVAYGGKDSAVVALGLIPLTLWVVRDYHHMRQSIYFSSLVVAAGYVHYGSLSKIVNIADVATAPIGWTYWLLVQSYAAVRLTLLVFGLGQQTPDFDYNQVTLEFAGMAVIILLTLFVLALYSYARRPLVAFGLAWLLIGVAPRLVVQTPKYVFNEHQYYLQFLGPVMAAVALTQRKTNEV